MTYNQTEAGTKIWKIWDEDWDHKLRNNPQDTSWVTLFLGHLKIEHPELLDPSKSDEQQYEDLKSTLTTSGRLDKYRK